MNLQRWKSRIALVTGASSGIGAAVATALATQVGMRVALMARREDRLIKLASELTQANAEVLICVGDVSNADDVERCFARVREHWGGLDVLVNNAGVAKMKALRDGNRQDWEHALSVNVAAPAHCMREALSAMVTREEGQIINISSVYAHRDQVPNFALYQASKAALKSLTNTLRAELAESGDAIRIGMISPGMVATEFREQATDGAFAYASYFENYAPLLPVDIAEAALYMLSTRPHVQVQDILLSPIGQGL